MKPPIRLLLSSSNLSNLSGYSVGSRRFCSSLSNVSEKQSSVQERQKANAKDKVKVPVFSGSDTPVNINFPNPKGVFGYDPDFTAKELLKSVPGVASSQAKLLKEELMQHSGGVEKIEMLEDIGLLRHNEARVEYRFNTDKSRELWKTGSDSDWNEGFSNCELVPTDHGTSIFRGTLSTAVLKDGRIERAGWASLKLEDRNAFNRKKYLTRWKNFSHLLIKCRGDGRSYKVMLHSPLAIDFTWGDSFSYPLHTHGGPYWQYEKIPFSRFFHTVNGRIQDKQYRVNLEDVSSLGIVLMDRMDGDFSLEIDCIGVYNDRSHVEDFAYETYTLPVFNTHGF
ncbi:unnamed protein product [Auanema sp. JU1783]|nr:unnamed protein product [Auanema sp. JU1783]